MRLWLLQNQAGTDGLLVPLCQVGASGNVKISDIGEGDISLLMRIQLDKDEVGPVDHLADEDQIR